MAAIGTRLNGTSRTESAGGDFGFAFACPGVLRLRSLFLCKKASKILGACVMSEPKHILAVEDDSAQRYLLARHLEKAGFRVTLARDPPTALHIAKRQPFDLVITDFFMPYADGGELVRQLRARPELRDTPMIIWTGRAGELESPVVVEGFSAPVVSKTESVARLLDVVSDCLAAALPSS